MRNLKEKTIPITKDDFICYLFIFIVGISIIHITLIATQVIVWDGIQVGLSSLSAVGIILGGIGGAIYWSDKWDLNPIHAIGYCLRWKK